jgi:membrane-bound serine protease (ClpP class)
MKKIIFLLSICLMGFGMLLPVAAQSLQEKIEAGDTIRIYKFDIKEMIAPPVWRSTQKAMSEAHELEVDLILVHMNTYGGTLDAADSIRTRILQSKIPVYVFIDNNAASAGALISIACDSIYMRPGANIGAATVVDQSGTPLPDKYQSYMRSMMRSTAEARGRNPDIAQGMVDPRIFIPNVTDTGQVITFTASEAVIHGFCEGKANDIDELLTNIGIEKYEITELVLTTTDRIIGFLIHPIVSGILIMIIIGGLYFELQTPGIGFPIGASVVAALLYFAPLYLEGIASNWEILLFVIGLILIAVELFAIPGFGITGILGVIFVVAGLVLAMVDNMNFNFGTQYYDEILQAFFTVSIASFLSLISSFYLSKKLFSGTTFGTQLALSTVQDSKQGFTSADVKYSSMRGKTGIAHTVLRPSGKVLIEDDIYDATSESGFIEKGEQVIVVKHETAQLFVRKV